MSLISFSPLQDGVTGVNAAATNTPLSTIYNDYNGNITDANIAAGAAIATSKLALSSAWTSYTPSWTSLGTAPAIGNGTLTGAYIQIGKTVICRMKWVAGSTTTFGTGSYRFSLPVNAISAASTPPSGVGTSPATSIGTWYGENPGTQGYGGTVLLLNASTVVLDYTTTSAAQLQIGATNPGSWANGWYHMSAFTYEAA